MCRAVGCRDPGSSSWKCRRKRRKGARVAVVAASHLASASVSVDRLAAKRPTAEKASATSANVPVNALVGDALQAR